MTSADADSRRRATSTRRSACRGACASRDGVALGSRRRIGRAAADGAARGALRRARADVEIAAAGPAGSTDVARVDCAAFGSTPRCGGLDPPAARRRRCRLTERSRARAARRSRSGYARSTLRAAPRSPASQCSSATAAAVSAQRSPRGCSRGLRKRRALAHLGPTDDAPRRSIARLGFEESRGVRDLAATSA